MKLSFFFPRIYSQNSWYALPHCESPRGKYHFSVSQVFMWNFLFLFKSHKNSVLPIICCCITYNPLMEDNLWLSFTVWLGWVGWLLRGVSCPVEIRRDWGWSDLKSHLSWTCIWLEVGSGCWLRAHLWLSIRALDPVHPHAFGYSWESCDGIFSAWACE